LGQLLVDYGGILSGRLIPPSLRPQSTPTICVGLFCALQVFDTVVAGHGMGRDRPTDCGVGNAPGRRNSRLFAHYAHRYRRGHWSNFRYGLWCRGTGNRRRRSAQEVFMRVSRGVPRAGEDYINPRSEVSHLLGSSGFATNFWR